MTTSQSHSPEIPPSAGKDEAAQTQKAFIEQSRQLVRDILAGKPEAEYVPADQVPDTTRIKAELVDSAKRRQIADAQQAVIDAIETMPLPPSLPFEDPSLN